MAAHAPRRPVPTLPSTGDDEPGGAPFGAELLDQVERLFDEPAAPATSVAPIRTGLEVELLCVSGRPPRPVPAARTRAALQAHDPALLREACISFEPGGQVELSPPAQPSTTALLSRLDGLLARLGRALAADGIVAASTGMNPWHSTEEVGLQLDAPRYAVMQRHFDAIGGAGRQMMRLTASLQVCLDRAGGDAGIEQWLLANRAGPALAAAFANSAVAQREVTGWTSTRSVLWQCLDVSRTGFDGAQVDGIDPVGAYCRFAAGAHPMPLPSQGGTGRPGGADVAHHLSTLFPPVRPRGYLEVRYLDAPPLRWLPVPVLVLQMLLGDAGARREALALLDGADRGTLLALWQASAHQGLANPWLRHEARALVDLALGAAQRAASHHVPPHAVDLLVRYRERYLDCGRCWSDDQAERITGPDAEDPTAWT